MVILEETEDTVKNVRVLTLPVDEPPAPPPYSPTETDPLVSLAQYRPTLAYKRLCQATAAAVVVLAFVFIMMYAMLASWTSNPANTDPVRIQNMLSVCHPSLRDRADSGFSWRDLSCITSMANSG
jgi:hypothetical protein